MVTPFATDFSITNNIFLLTEVNLFSNNAFFITVRINFLNCKTTGPVVYLSFILICQLSAVGETMAKLNIPFFLFIT